MRRIQWRYHTYFQIKIRLVTSSDILIPSLEIFTFLMLYFLWCFSWHADVFNLHSGRFFSNNQNYKKTIDSNYRDEITANKQQSQSSPNLQRCFLFIHSLLLFVVYLPFLHSFYSSLHSLYCVKHEVWMSTSEYTYGCYFQKNTCVLAVWVSHCNCPRQLTSYADISHS